MATRENQGLQIALILFLLLTVGLAVTTFIFYKREQEVAESAKHLTEELETMTNKRNDALLLVVQLKKCIGVPVREDVPSDHEPSNETEEAIKEIQTMYEEDMLAFGQDWEPKNYSRMDDYLLPAIRDINTKLVAEIREKEQIAAQMRTEIEKVRGLHAVVVKGQKDIGANFMKRSGELEAERDRTVAVMRKMETQMATTRKSASTQLAKRDEEVKSLEESLKRADNIRAAAVAKLHGETKTDTDRPDGKITWVNQRSKLVWINLGTADALRRETNFGVYDKDTANVARATPKGSIEVTKILDGHLAEARILDDDLANAILPGDVVYSPVWKAGRRLRFALAGFMDYDGDGKSDRKEIRSLILANSGIIDAEIHDNGDRTGRLTINTRYLVLGDRPTEKTDQKAREGYMDMDGDATEKGVEKISVDRLLDMMGFAGGPRTVRLGKDAKASDFKAKPAGGVPRTSTGTTGADSFRSRRPPSSGSRSAYDR